MGVITDAAVDIEEVDTLSYAQQSDIAVEEEQVDTLSYGRITNISVMVEYSNVTGRCGIGDIGLVVYNEFARGLHCYLSRADEAGLSITGELTLGCWVWFNTKSMGVDVGLLGKWYDHDQRAYVLHKRPNNEIEFSISQAGTNNLNTITDQGINYKSGNWYYIVGRFNPSTEMSLFVNGIWYRNTAGIFPSIFDSTEPFEIGRYNRSNYMDGYICHAFVSASYIEDADVMAMYAHTKAMFGNAPEYENAVVQYGGIDERMTNAAVMIEVLPAGFIRMTNAALMVEKSVPSYINLTNAAVMIEYAQTANKLRLTNAAVSVEYKQTVNKIRMTSAAVMIEYVPTHNYIRETNAAVMIEYEAV